MSENDNWSGEKPESYIFHTHFFQKTINQLIFIYFELTTVCQPNMIHTHHSCCHENVTVAWFGILWSFCTCVPSRSMHNWWLPRHSKSLIVYRVGIIICFLSHLKKVWIFFIRRELKILNFSKLKHKPKHFQWFLIYKKIQNIT